MNLEGKKGLIIGVANDQSIAWGCAKAMKDRGADLAMTYLNDKAKPYVEPLADEVGAEIFKPLEVQDETQWKALFDEIQTKWGKLDFAIHSVAFAPKEDLHGRVVDCSAEGFCMAMNISCHSFIRMAHYCEPLMKDGGALMTMSYYGAQKVVKNYKMMGPVKAALEASVRELSIDLGEGKIRVNALSAGPLKTRASSGLSHFDDLLDKAAKDAPLHQLTTIYDVGAMAAFLASDNARHVTGQTLFVDAGYNVIGG